MSFYLSILKKYNINPNFWCSEEYWKKVDWEEKYLSYGKLFIQDKKGINMLPPLSEKGKILSDNYWAGMSNFNIFGNDKFLDYEFIYNPSLFFDLKGSKWRKIRKNLKWCKEDIKEELIIVLKTKTKNIDLFLYDWIKDNDSKQWFEPEVMMDYIFNGENRIFFIGKKSKKIYGICIWDENWKYINFRYCLVQKKIRGLSDYCRVKFYQFVSEKNKLVNDGGSLDNESLYRYKEKLNPIIINKIYGGNI